MICRKKCQAWEFYDPKDPQNCFLCWDAISGCNVCDELNKQVGAQLQCSDCGNVLVPAYQGTECIHKGCKKLDSNYPDFCMECLENYIMDFETSKCYEKTCPLSHFQLDLEEKVDNKIVKMSFCVKNC